MGRKTTTFNTHAVEATTEDRSRLDESREKAMNTAKLASDLRSTELALAAQAYADIYRADVARASSVID